MGISISTLIFGDKPVLAQKLKYGINYNFIFFVYNNDISVRIQI